MNYYAVPSLEHFALLKTAITLWNQDDIKNLTGKFYTVLYSTDSTEREWRVAENRVIGKVKDLPLPESTKKKVLGFIKPIGDEILKWMYHHCNILSGVRNILKKLCWTRQGTIDRKKTAEELISDDNLEISERYKLACINCLEDDILMLWNKMPEDCRKSFFNEEARHINQDELVVYWTYNIKGELPKMNYYLINETRRRLTPYQYAFESAIVSKNEVAVEYFWQKLTSEERKLSFISSEYRNRIMSYYVLSQLNEEQQVQMFREQPSNVLSCFLVWPWQCFFMEMAKGMWSFLPKDCYHELLRQIVQRVKEGFKDYDYQKLFREFWQQSPLAHKEFAVDKCAVAYCIEIDETSLLLELLQTKDKENFKLILEDATVLGREKIIFSDVGKRICEYLIYDGEMDFLEFFVQECISSKDVMIEFRKSLELYKYVIAYGTPQRREIDEGMWSKVFQLLDDLIRKYDKK